MLLRYPLNRIKITQGFGERPEVYKPFRGHMGIDFRTIWNDSPSGMRSVYAAASGKVLMGNQGKSGYGKFVKIRHSDHSETIYGHLSDWSVEEGQLVIVGERIGISGTTGFSSAPHLHFGYRPPNFNPHDDFGGYINPLPFMTTELFEPYFEQVKGQNIIAFYKKSIDMMVPFDDVDDFKSLFGDYQNILVNNVEKWSRPLASKKLLIA